MLIRRHGPRMLARGWLIASLRIAGIVALSSAAAIECAAADSSAAEMAAKKQDGKVAGILFDFDLKAGWITVKADGEDAPIKYIVPQEKKLTDVLGKTVFPASRVELTYKTVDSARRLVGVKRQILQPPGVMTGTVVALHNDFWLELKPRKGPADAFAPGANYNDKAFMEKLKSLKPGEVVTIVFTTDFERHRIQSLERVAMAGKPTKNDGKPVSGIVIERQDDSLVVKADGESDPVAYRIDQPVDKKLSAALKAVFPVSRVQVAYKADGDSRRLVSVKKLIPKASGSVTGVVLKNYGWWVEVKPKTGVAEGYAVHFPFDANKDMMNQLQSIQEGDTVTIQFTTDFERHRIESLRKADGAAR